MCDTGQASMAYFYFDFRNINKQYWRDLVPSLLTQLSTCNRIPVAIFYHIFILTTATVHNSPLMTF